MKRSITTFILLLSFLSLAAQSKNVKGTVYYQNSRGTTEPLPFAQIYYIEGEKLLECDDKGTFTISLNDKATLIATYVGYSQDTLVVMPNAGNISFTLTGSNEVEESIVTARQAALSRLNAIKTEVITTAGLCKMACCNLAESFENSASVAVGYSDAVTGVKQIKLLGLSNVYTQMLDENIPTMRGLAAPYGMAYVPGQWLESIQIAKGPASTVNGMEAITGQINVEHRKPIDETPLFINLYGSTDLMTEANVASALQINEKWSTILLGHYSGTQRSMDHNHDGFRDDPYTQQFSFGNRWLYYNPNGVQVRFGWKYTQDYRLGGQMSFTKEMAGKQWEELVAKNIWGSLIRNRLANGYLKVGFPLKEDQSESIAIVADFSHYNSNSTFGYRDYDGRQNSGYLNFLYQNQGVHHSIEVGASARMDWYKERYAAPELKTLMVKTEARNDRNEGLFGAFAEYTYKNEEKVTVVAGVRGDYNTLYNKFLFTPRVTAKYSFTDNLILRLSAGRGFHSPLLFADNLWTLSTGRGVSLDDFRKRFELEEAWTYGGNITAYLPFGYENNSYISFEFFRSDFINQLIVDQENTYLEPIAVYNLKDVPNGRSFTNTYQADFSSDITENLNLVLTFRYTDAKVTLRGKGLVERPLVSRYKAVLNAQYKTRLSKWIFDLTCQLNGPARLPNFCEKEFSEIYPMLYAQITRKFKGFDIYIGVENITNYRQKDPIIKADAPFSRDFNASVVWGPLMGTKGYLGLRYTLWK
ncbi:MAG: TonB-dependent receptor [Bacteroidales bacterium]|nr:TonB-dependent receptor [Bacteroidales bacterium]